MKQLNEITHPYVVLLNTYDSERDRLNDKIELREKQIERLKKKSAKNYCPFWTEGDDSIIEPLAKELMTYFPDRPFYEILGPFGMRSNVSIWLTKIDTSICEYEDKFKLRNILSVTLIPGELSKGELFFETGEIKERFHSGTIGEVNGLNKVIQKVESIQQLVEVLRKQEEQEINKTTKQPSR